MKLPHAVDLYERVVELGGVRRWMELDEREVDGWVGTNALTGAEEVRNTSAADENRDRQQIC